MDNPDETPLGERWLTMGQIAAVRGISKQSAHRLVRRKGWRRQTDNHGFVQALVPPEFQAANGSASLSDNTSDNPRDAPTDRVTLAALIDAFRVTVDRERDRADKLEAELKAAQDALREAQGRAGEAERALDAARAGGRVRRAWRAWRGR